MSGTHHECGIRTLLDEEETSLSIFQYHLLGAELLSLDTTHSTLVISHFELKRNITPIETVLNPKEIQEGDAQKNPMILIPIKRQQNQRSRNERDEDDTPQEWSLLELNGELIPPIRQSSSVLTKTCIDKNNVNEYKHIELGSIKFDSESGEPILTLGGHELKGKMQTLKQPFAVMRKRKYTNRCQSSTNNEKKTKKTDSSLSSNQTYEIAGIIQKKVLFDTYPKTIV